MKVMWYLYHIFSKIINRQIDDKKKKIGAFITRASHVVTHSTTGLARRSLTSPSGREGGTFIRDMNEDISNTTH